MMSSDTNECRLSGTIDRLKAITTKTGKPMAEILLRVRQDRFRVIAFGNVAEAMLAHARSGDRLNVTGSLTASSWQDDAGEWKYSFGVTAWTVELNDGEKVNYQRREADSAAPKTGEVSRRKTTPSPYTRAGEFQAGPNDPF